MNQKAKAIQTLFLMKKIDVKGVQLALEKNIITKEEFEIIMGE